MIVALSVISFALVGALAGLDLRCSSYRGWPMLASLLWGAVIGGIFGLALGLFLEGVVHGAP